MWNMVLLSTAGTGFLFLVQAVLLTSFGFAMKNVITMPPSDGEDAVRKLVGHDLPLDAAIVLGFFIIAAFLLLLVGISLPTRRQNGLAVAGYAVLFCALSTLALGVDVWILTLKTTATFSTIWRTQDAAVQGLMEKAFSCCGYLNSMSPAFVTNDVCSSPAAAALLRGCSSFVASFANKFVNLIFTSLFGFVAVDVLLILAIVCLVKDRQERQRYRYIDEKTNDLTL